MTINKTALLNRIQHWRLEEAGVDLQGAILRGPEAQKIQDLVLQIQACLSNDLRDKEYQDPKNPMKGHCYAASEALWYALGGKNSRWKAVRAVVGGGPHWWLQHKDTGDIVDITAGQFSHPVDYASGVGKGFNTYLKTASVKILQQLQAKGLEVEYRTPIKKP